MRFFTSKITSSSLYFPWIIAQYFFIILFFVNSTSLQAGSTSSLQSSTLLGSELDFLYFSFPHAFTTWLIADPISIQKKKTKNKTFYILF